MSGPLFCVSVFLVWCGVGGMDVLTLWMDGGSLDTAVEHDAKGASGYEFIFNAIRGGCKAAIWISSRV